MDELALRVRTFVYTMICFQCLIQLSVGNSFYKYLKLISQLFALCICCNIVFSFFGIVEDGWEQADRIYEQWEEQWQSKSTLADMEGYLQGKITEGTVEEFEQQIRSLLEKETKGSCRVEEIVWNNGRWEVTISGTQLQENENFVMLFKESVCRKFSLGEEELEVITR